MKRQQLNNQYNVSISSVVNDLHFFTLKQSKGFEQIIERQLKFLEFDF